MRIAVETTSRVGGRCVARAAAATADVPAYAAPPPARSPGRGGGDCTTVMPYSCGPARSALVAEQALLGLAPGPLGYGVQLGTGAGAAATRAPRQTPSRARSAGSEHEQRPRHREQRRGSGRVCRGQGQRGRARRGQLGVRSTCAVIGPARVQATWLAVTRTESPGSTVGSCVSVSLVATAERAGDGHALAAVSRTFPVLCTV